MAFVFDLFAAIGAVVVGAGAVGAATLWLFRTFSEKWLSAKFEEQLAAYKHVQQKELEHLKFQINALMDRATKLHQREFEALPEAWARLMHAHGIIASLVSRLQSTPDLDGMQPDQLDDFLTHTKLAAWQRDAVTKATDKTKAYRNQIEPFKIVRARKASRRFYVYFRSNGIFIRDPIKADFAALDELMLTALNQHVMNFQHNLREFGDIDKLASTGEAMIKRLEVEVQKRLWDSAPSDTVSV